MLSDGIAFGETQSRTEEFVFELAGQATQQINKVIIYNEGEGGQNLYSKDFQVLIATESGDDESFQEIVSATLEPWTGPQTIPGPLVSPSRGQLARCQDVAKMRPE